MLKIALRAQGQQPPPQPQMEGPVPATNWGRNVAPPVASKESSAAPFPPAPNRHDQSARNALPTESDVKVTSSPEANEKERV